MRTLPNFKNSRPKIFIGHREGLFLFSALAVLLVDQWIKGVTLEYYPSLIRINSGMALGLFPNRALFLVGVTACVFFLLARLSPLWAKGNFLSLALVWGGGVSNFYDRLIRGGIVDVFNLWGGLSFNLADAAIVLGVVLLLRRIVWCK